MEFWDSEDVRSIICNAPPSGDMLGLFESGGKFYIIEMIGGEIYRIDDPTTEDDIVLTIKGKGLDALRLVNLIDEAIEKEAAKREVTGEEDTGGEIS